MKTHPKAASSNMGSHGGRIAKARPLRPLTVDEALSYTSLSSIVPFSSEAISLPEIGVSGSSPLFQSAKEQSNAREILGPLNRAAHSNPHDSPLVKETLRDIGYLINRNHATEYNFKKPLDPYNPLTPDRVSSQGPSESIVKLDLFPQMLLEATSVSYNYGLKAKPLPKSKKNKSPKVPKKPQLPQQLPITSTNHNAIHHNAQITLEASQGFPQRTIPEPVVIVPGLPSSSQHDDYETFPEVDAMMVKENKELVSRKHNKLDTQRGTTQVRDSDRMAKSEGILIGLKELIGEIFEAEDQMQSDTSGQKSTNASNLFDSAASGDVEILTLAAPALAKLDSLISNLSAADRFSEIPAEDLCRLQKLCEGSLHTAESLDLRLENARGEYDIDRWLVLLSLADSGLKSSKTLLRMMTAGREEKQLYSEEMLQSILGVLKNILESCLIPTAELRRSGPTLELFKLIHPHNKYLSSLLIQSSKVLRLLALLFSKEKVDNAITTVLFLSTQLIFVENAHSDKDSVFGVQKFENLRVAAMDVLAKIFLKHTDQRTFIFDEILTSLEKLPITRQSARQYKLIEGKNIQLVSALIMRLVQTSALPCDDSFGISSRKYSTDNAEKEEEDGSSDQDGDGIVVINEEKASSHPNSAIQSLSQLTKPLLDSAYRNAHFIVKFIVARALKSTKTGDAPYRNLLDIFAEDFIAVLNSTDWPAAELLLQQLLSTMIGISGDEKQPAPAKTMALDLMGLMGSAIADINTQIRQMTNSIEKNDTNLSGIVAQLAEESLEGKIREYDMLAWDGPQRAILEHLDERDLIDEQLQSASGFLTTQWSNSVCKYFESADEDEADESEIGELGILAYRLRKMNLDRKWLREEYKYESVTTAQAKLSYTLLILNLPFCRALDRILLIMLSSMNSDQATVRSKSLKSVIQLLEKDPSILDRGTYVLSHIIQRTTDQSPLVRDAAVGLLGKCLALKPELEEQIVSQLLARSSDTAVGVRKRAMRLLKDIYLNSAKSDVKSAIAEALLLRIKDSDEGICDLARQIFEEVWISPFYEGLKDADSDISFQLAIKNQVSLIVKTVEKGGIISSTLESLLKTILVCDGKHVRVNFRVCEIMVAVMFDLTIDGKERNSVLHVLTIFSKVNPKLFQPKQIGLLQPYIQNLSANDESHVYRSVLIIFRWVLPHLPTIPRSFLGETQKALLESLSKSAAEMSEVVHCLCTINLVLDDTERLAKVALTCLKNVLASKDNNLSDKTQSLQLTRVYRLINILGPFGKYCNLENHLPLFQQAFSWWKGDSVAGLMVEIISPFTSPKQPLLIRKAALQNLGLVSHSWPKLFLKVQVYTAFEHVFNDNNKELQSLVLRTFKEFLGAEEKRSENNSEGILVTGNSADSGRLGGALPGNQNDGVSESIAQRFLSHAIRIALVSDDNHALIAVEVVASVNRQGLLHPKEYGPALVALETSRNPHIARIALQEHRTLHQKHETIIEKEYMRAIYEAFKYQKNVAGDALGARQKPFSAKLHSLFEVLKISNLKFRKKFLSNLCSRIDFDPNKIEVNNECPEHLVYSRFIIENLASFDYNSVDELLHVARCMERVVAGTGTSLAHAIETEIFKENAEQFGGDGTIPEAATPSDHIRFKQLTASTMILSMLWAARSFLRRLYSLEKHQNAKAKLATKDLNKAPSKIHSIDGESFMTDIGDIMTGLESEEKMKARCQSFVEILSIDNDFKVAAEAEDGVVAAHTPSGDEDGEQGEPSTPADKAKGRKRKSASLTPGKKTAKKPRRQSISKTKGTAISLDSNLWD